MKLDFQLFQVVIVWNAMEDFHIRELVAFGDHLQNGVMEISAISVN